MFILIFICNFASKILLKMHQFVHVCAFIPIAKFYLNVAGLSLNFRNDSKIHLCIDSLQKLVQKFCIQVYLNIENTRYINSNYIEHKF